MDTDVAKAAARVQALEGRAAGGDQQALDRNLALALQPYAGRLLAGYWPMRGEPDPRPAMAAHGGALCLPVVPGRAVPLLFRRWQGEDLVPGPYGTSHPPDSAEAVFPDVLIVPLVGFDSRLNRVGYGGGYYDRTLEMLRLRRPTAAIGVAWAGQELPSVPTDEFDQRLDAIVTDRGVLNTP